MATRPLLHGFLVASLSIATCAPMALAQVFINNPDCNPMCGGSVVITSAGTTYTYTTTGCTFAVQHIRLLGSPSGLAHDNGNGFQIQLKQDDGSDIFNFVPGGGHLGLGGAPELWLTGPPFSNGTGMLVCYEPQIPSVLDIVYHQTVLAGSAVTVLPTFGGAGQVQVQIKMCDQQYGPVGTFFDGRSTDIDADGDCDEVDEAAMRAAIGGTNMDYDLNWSGAVDTADLNLLLVEARRHVTGAVCDLDGYLGLNEGGNGTPNAYNTARNVQYLPATTTNLAVTRIDANTVRLSWTAPADDGASGRAATGYDVRRSSSAITSTSAFNAATVISSPPAPGTPGATQTMDVTLAAGTSAHFAIRSKDDVDNWSAVSNSPQIQNTAPATTTNLSGTAGRYMVILNWTAPGEDGSFGTASSYDVRYRTGSTFTEANWASAMSAGTAPTPEVAGTTQCMLVTDLAGCTQYSIAVKSVDASGQWSAISNVKTTTTKCSGNLSFECGGFAARPALEEDEALTLSLGGLQPNPTRTGGLVSYTIPASAAGETIDLGVFDVSGRRTMTLATGASVVGRHSVAWDLRSESGERARPGVYFVRLRLGQTTLNRVVQVMP